VSQFETVEYGEGSLEAYHSAGGRQNQPGRIQSSGLFCDFWPLRLQQICSFMIHQALRSAGFVAQAVREFDLRF
jgi:hypothetical protein